MGQSHTYTHDCKDRGEKPACTGSQPAVTAADFSVLYQRCMVRGLKARVTVSHAAGCQVFTLSCNLPAPAMTNTTAGRRRRRQQRRGRAANTVGEEPTQPSPPVAAARGDSPLPAPLPLPPAPTPLSLPKIQSPPATPPATSPTTIPTTTSVLPPSTLPSSWKGASASPSPDTPMPPTLLESPLHVASSPACTAQSSALLPYTTLPSPPLPRTPHQEGWNLCMTCRKHYHHKMYYHYSFCNFK
jgi:hypothetical protein